MPVDIELAAVPSRWQALPVTLRDRLRRAGLPLVLGVVSLLAAVAVYQFECVPRQQRLAALEEDIATRRATLAADHGTSPKRDADTLPARGAVPTLVGAVLKEAQKAGVPLDRGTYGVSVLRGGRALRYQFDFPIKTSYPNLRHFLDGCLGALPDLALDALSIERKAITDREVEARVSFTVVTRGAP